MTITAGTSAKGSGTVSYSVAANTFITVRTGSLTIAGKAFTVTQQGASCSLSLNPTSASIQRGGGATDRSL